ncbi:MAG: hypothetical protein DRR42_12295 [Gammaproteobacteria bacterium]|nr:MAG: hypothetical protein DRR42_12295 [Gammaproteobacteria bacterium]
MIEIKPEIPSSDDAVVFVFQTGQNGCCYFSKSIVGSHYYFEEIAYDPPTPIIATPIPVNEYWNVGRLEAGEYQVTQLDLRTGTTTQDFSVSEGALPFPVPTIPTIGVTGAIVLVIGLAWIANKGV